MRRAKRKGLKNLLTFTVQGPVHKNSIYLGKGVFPVDVCPNFTCEVLSSEGSKIFLMKNIETEFVWLSSEDCYTK